jgi:hypothetical protein
VEKAEIILRDKIQIHNDKTVDKKSNPTDRTKVDFSSKEDSRKDTSVINSSQKKTYKYPISLTSTYEATGSFQPIQQPEGNEHIQE